MSVGNKNISLVVEALQESQNDAEAAIRSLESQVTQREAEAQGLRQAILAIKMLIGEPPPSRDRGSQPSLVLQTGTPSGMEAIRRVMREGGVWTAATMFEELKKRGWEPKEASRPRAAVEASMDRLYRVKKEIERVGRGEYAMKGFPASPSLETLGDYAS